MSLLVILKPTIRLRMHILGEQGIAVVTPKFAGVTCPPPTGMITQCAAQSAA